MSYGIPKKYLSFFYFLFQGQITLMDVPVFKAIQPDVSSLKNFPFKYTKIDTYSISN